MKRRSILTPAPLIHTKDDMSAQLNASTDPVLTAVQSGVRTYDLGRLLTIGMPQSPNHPPFWHALPRRHGDAVRSDGASAANDLITMGTHVGTHIDALAHVSQDGKLFGGADAATAGITGRYPSLGVHTIAPIVRPGVLLDIPAALGANRCEGGLEITVEHLKLAAQLHGSQISAGDVVLIRTGWGQHFDSGDGAAYLGHDSGVPGIGAAGAQWLADQRIHAAGADTIAFERLGPKAGHSLLPAHRVLLVEHGIYIVEALALEELAAAGVHQFVFILSPLPLFGATGSPVRPLAVVANA